MSSSQPTMQEPCYFRNINGSTRISKTWDLLSKSAVEVKSYYGAERNQMSAKKITKKQICDAAVEMYLDNPSSFSLSAVASRVEIPRSDIYQIFPTKNSVLRFFYQDCFEQYLKQTDELKDLSLIHI